MSAPTAVATRHGSNANVSTSIEVRIRSKLRLGIQKWTLEPRERTNTKVSAESDFCVPCRLRLSAQCESDSCRGTLTGVQLPTVGFWARVRVRALAFFSSVVSFKSTPFEYFSMVLDEIARGSFCGLVAIPSASTWSRAWNSRQSPLGTRPTRGSSSSSSCAFHKIAIPSLAQCLTPCTEHAAHLPHLFLCSTATKVAHENKGVTDTLIQNLSQKPMAEFGLSIHTLNMCLTWRKSSKL